MKVLATDLDGTLFDVKSETRYVCLENVQVLNDFDKVIIVSGRPANFIKKVCNEIQIPYTFIACNGAAIYLDGKIIYYDFVSTATVREIIDYTAKNCHDFSILLFDKHGDIYSYNDNPKKSEEREIANYKLYPKLQEITNKDMNKINELLSEENSLVKVNLLLSPEEKEMMYDFLITNYSNTISAIKCRRFIEINNKGVTKGGCLKKLVNYLHLDESDVYVAGDDTNDLSMLTAFKNSFVIKNTYNENFRDKVKYQIDKFCDIKEYIKE